VVYPICQLGVPQFHGWVFGLGVVELCTATKPFYAKKLLDAGYEFVFYFDPDTYVYNNLQLLIDELADDDVLVTPHCTQEAGCDAEIHYNEMSSLAHGVFNLGFVGFKQSEVSHAVVDFWKRRMLRHCVDDHARGLFTDQKWFNLVPVFFDRVKVSKNKGFNTASWNIASRPITRTNGEWKAGGEPLVFFHFSGYDRNVPRAMFDVFGQFNADLAELIKDYDNVNENLARQHPESKFDSAFAFYDNGEPVTGQHRELYRTKFELQIAYPAPFETSGTRSYYGYLGVLGSDGLAQQTNPPGMLRRFF